VLGEIGGGGELSMVRCFMQSVVPKFGSKRIPRKALRCLTWQDLLARRHQSFEELKPDQVLLICFVDDLFVVLKRKYVLLDIQLVIA
jgi:hypothetical protein